MRIVVSEHKRLSPYISLFVAKNETGKVVLKLIGQKYFDNTDLYALEKLGFKIIRKTHK